MTAVTPRGTDIVIDGMSCAGCVARIEKALRATPGVSEASVNLLSQRATVQGTAPADALIAAIRALGYGARLVQPEQAPTPADTQGWRDVLVSVLLTLPLVIPMLLTPLGIHSLLPPAAQAALATVVQLLFGTRFCKNAWIALRHGSASMDLLVATGTSAAWALSLYVMLFTPHAAHGLWFESGAVVITLVLLGKQLEQRARRQTRHAIEALQSLRPPTARRLMATGEERIDPARLTPGDHVRVLAGETVPADGRILVGQCQVDESMLTGENIPVTRAIGDAVSAGTLALDGALDIEITATGQDTTLARIIAWVEAAQNAKAPAQKLADRISAVFVPAVMVIAALTLATLFLQGAGIETAIVRAVTVLVIACPCALGLATPVALMAGTGAAARAGILIKDIDALERAARIDAVAFDKTGTLTEGRPRVVAQQVFGEEAALIAIAAGLQACTTHPVGHAFRQLASERSLAPVAVETARLVPGQGVSGSIDGTPWVIGNETLLNDHGLDTAPLRPIAREAADRGETPIWLAHAGPTPHIDAVFSVVDTVRADSHATIQRLQRMGIASLMITGDTLATARRIASTLGITSIHAGIRPDAKASLVTSLQDAGQRIAMVGDGINDAPALASADLGIALGSGTDVARHTAAITLLGGGIHRVPDALDIARLTRRALRQNLFLAFAYNVIGIPLAVMGALNPMLAGAAMAASSLSVVLNALRLNRWRPGH